MIINKSFFFKKKILIYGLGKSGISAFKFLKKKQNKLYIFDDKKIPKKKSKNFETNMNTIKDVRVI